MPVIELDMLIAFVNSSDRHHAAADNLFLKIKEGKIKDVSVASSAYLEYELVHKSTGQSERETREELRMFGIYPNLGEEEMNLEVLVEASRLREVYGLTFFDSLHAASALMKDGKIISRDECYDRVKGLERVEVRGV